MTSPEKSNPPEEASSRRKVERIGPPPLSRLELACMRAVWCEAAQTVNQVQHCLHPRRPLAYTTILTILDRLVHKGALTRVKQGKAYCYEPVVSFQESREKAVMELVDFYFDGSREKLQEFLTSSTSQFEAEPSSDQTKSDSPEMNVCLL